MNMMTTIVERRTPPIECFLALVMAFDSDDMATATELLIELMDRSDGDPDLEDGCDQEAISECEPDEDSEASLGAPERFAGSWASNMGGNSDCELDASESLMRQHRDRIRRDRCERTDYRWPGGWTETRYRLPADSGLPVCR